MTPTYQEHMDNLGQLMFQYIRNQQRDTDDPRPAIEHAKGKLEGYCLAFGYSIEEDDKAITIRTKYKGFVMSMEKELHPCRVVPCD